MTTQTATGFTVQDEGSVAVTGPRLVAPAARPLAVAVPAVERAAPIRRASRRHWRPLCLAVADLVSAAVALAAFDATSGLGNAAVLIAVAPLVLLLGIFAGHYARHELQVLSSTLDETPAILTLTGLCALGLAIAEPAFVGNTLNGPQLALVWGGLFLAIVGGRTAVRSAVRRVSQPERCLVIGDPNDATTISDRFATSGTHATVVAVLPLARGDAEAAAELGSQDAMDTLVREIGADRIILAPGDIGVTATVDLVRAAKSVGVRVSLLTAVIDVVGPTIGLDDVHGLTLLGVHSLGLSPASRLAKRTLDLVLATIGGILIAPALAVIAIAIRLESDGPVFFRQIRVGRDGREFRIVKFRSMVANAEEQKESLRQLSEVGDGMFKMTDDPRVTRIGRFLRRSSLDELPQIFNVMRGEMSLVGPRPLVVEEDDEISGLDRCRLSLMPGMTGPWQILPTRLPKRDMIRMDYRYATNWSLWLDIKILLRTGLHVLRRGNH
jgi:exopolysaccharide biosynthesis polyprenyl glycosylphosphotransferase